MIVICIILTVFLQEISNSIKYSMFSDPNDLQEWDDHIQIVMVLKGLFKKNSIFSFIFYSKLYWAANKENFGKENSLQRKGCKESKEQYWQQGIGITEK